LLVRPDEIKPAGNALVERFDHNRYGDIAHRSEDDSNCSNGLTGRFLPLLGKRSAHTQQHLVANIIIQCLSA
jgi:hypothetical protein